MIILIDFILHIVQKDKITSRYIEIRILELKAWKMGVEDVLVGFSVDRLVHCIEQLCLEKLTDGSS